MDQPKLLLDKRALLAAMAYVDLNPIRASIACNLMDSRNTSSRLRCKAVRANPELADEFVLPIGCRVDDAAGDGRRIPRSGRGPASARDQAGA